METKHLKKVDKKNSEQYQVFIYNFLKDNGKIFLKISELYKAFVRQNVSIYYKYYSFKSRFHLFIFSHLVTCMTFSIFQDNTLLPLIIHLYFFKWFSIFKFNMPNQTSDMNSFFMINFIIISIIKVDIIKIYIKNSHFITKKWRITRIFIKIE